MSLKYSRGGRGGHLEADSLSPLTGPLQEHEHPKTPAARTPLPAGQLSILLFLRFCEAAATFSIYPYLNELLTSVIDGDKDDVGHYAGLMEAIRQFMSLVTVMYWSRLSDHVGRKPILLLGTASLAFSMLGFGLSKTFWSLVISRCIFTALNSNAGVIKGTVGEITDHSNSADAFALLHIPWAIGTSVGPILGGVLANPHDRFPGIFTGLIWIEYPYLLPCVATAIIAAIGVLLVALFLQETINERLTSSKQSAIREDEAQPLLGADIPATNEEPVSISDLLTNQPVLLAISNYVSLSFLNAALNSLQPLFLAMPINLGGLGLDPATIGIILGAYGAASSIFQAFLLGPLERLYGVKRIFLSSIMVFLPVMALFPVMNLIAREAGMSNFVWFFLVCQLLFSLVLELGYGCVYMFITSASPNRRSLGAVNGLGQTLVSIARIIAPAITSSLLSFSIHHNLLSGYAVYLFVFAVTLGCIRLAMYLPSSLWIDM